VIRERVPCSLPGLLRFIASGRSVAGGQSTLDVGGRAGKLVLPVICEQFLVNTDGVHSLRGFPPVFKRCVGEKLHWTYYVKSFRPLPQAVIFICIDRALGVLGNNPCQAWIEAAEK